MSANTNNSNDVQRIGGLVAEASMIATQITNTDAKSAKSLIARLIALMNQAHGSPAIASMINAMISSAESSISQREMMECDLIIAEAYKSWSPETQKLYDELNNAVDANGNKVLTLEDKKFLASIDPNKPDYKIAAFDEQGNLKKDNSGKVIMIEGKGTDIQEAFIKLKAHAHKHLLSRATQDQLNSPKGQIELKEAVRIVQGHAYSLANDDIQRQSIVADAQETLSLLKQPRLPNDTVQKTLSHITDNVVTMTDASHTKLHDSNNNLATTATQREKLVVEDTSGIEELLNVKPKEAVASTTKTPDAKTKPIISAASPTPIATTSTITQETREMLDGLESSKKLNAPNANDAPTKTTVAKTQIPQPNTNAVLAPAPMENEFIKNFKNEAANLIKPSAPVITPPPSTPRPALTAMAPKPSNPASPNLLDRLDELAEATTFTAPKPLPQIAPVKVENSPENPTDRLTANATLPPARPTLGRSA